MTRAAEGALKLLRAPLATGEARRGGLRRRQQRWRWLCAGAPGAGRRASEALVLAAAPPGQARRRCAPRAGGMAGRGRQCASLRRPTRCPGSDVIVDGLLGIGLRRAAAARDAGGDPRHQCGDSARCWRSTFPPASNADSGAVHEAAVRAELTLSFVGFEVRTVPRRRARTCRRGAARRSRRGGARACRIRAAHAPHRRSRNRGDAAAPRARVTQGARTAACSSSAAAPACRVRCAWRAMRRCACGAGLVTVAGAAENLVAVTAARPELIYLPVALGTSLDEACARCRRARHRARPRHRRMGAAPVVAAC